MRNGLEQLCEKLPAARDIVDTLEKNPGATRNRIRTLTGLPERSIIEAIAALKLGEHIFVTAAFGMEFHWLPGQDIVEPTCRADVHPGRKGYPKPRGRQNQ